MNRATLLQHPAASSETPFPKYSDTGSFHRHLPISNTSVPAAGRHPRFFRFFAYGSGNPVTLPQRIENCSPYPPRGIGLELKPPLVVEFFDGINESHDTVAGQIVLGDVFGQPYCQTAGHVINNMEITLNQLFLASGSPCSFHCSQSRSVSD